MLLKKFAGHLLIALGVLAVATGTSAHAQIAPYAMFSASHYSGQGVGNGTAANQSGGITPLGGTFGAYGVLQHLGPAQLGGDVRLMVQNSANSTPYGNKLIGGFVGLRLDAGGVPAIPVNPYFQFEIGGVGTNSGASYNRTAGFAYQAQFGGDFTLVPHLLDGRLEYGAGQVENIGNTNHTLQTFGVGLVLRLP